MLSDRPLTIATLFRVFRARIALIWTLSLPKPLFIGFAIDDLLTGDTASFWHMAGIMALLIGLSVV